MQSIAPSLFVLTLLLLTSCAPRGDKPSASGTVVDSGESKLVSSEAPSSLAARIDQVLADNLNGRLLDSEVNAAWQIMHGVISYGEELPLKTPDRGVVGALDYAFTGGQIMGFELMPGNHVLAATGRPGLKARLEPGSYMGQGHVDQWLAIFAMANVPIDTQVTAGDQQFTLLDWARQAQLDVSNNILDEYSWTLIAMTHYFPNEPRWTMANGSPTSWEALVERELTQDLTLSPCGGTHRLAGITRALHAAQRLGIDDTPVWQQARAVVEESLRKAKAYRGHDGTLSSYYFERPGGTSDLSAELASAGHVLEFVALAAPQETLADPWVETAVNRLCEILEATREVDLDCGALYHGLNGLKIYQQRRYAPASL